MSDAKQFNHEQLRGAKFHGCGLAHAEFDNVDLSQSKFNGVNLRNSTFTDVNLSDVSIDDANVAGLKVFGWNITELITEAQKRETSIRTQSSRTVGGLQSMKTQGVAPVLQVSSLNDSLKYYGQVLGFMEDFRFGDYAGVRHGEVLLHLCAHDFHKRPIGGGTVSIFCDEVDNYFDEIKKKGAIVKVGPENRPYGMRDFMVLDPDGNHLSFGCESPKS